MRARYRLCLALGVAHPDLLAAVLTPQQEAGWLAYMTVEPIGTPLVDSAVARLLATMLRSQGAEVLYDDFLPDRIGALQAYLETKGRGGD